MGPSPDWVKLAEAFGWTGILCDRKDDLAGAMKTALDGQPFPPNASTLVGVTRLGHPQMLIEISAVTAVP